jgi:release factor glutamine methyltransferase
VTFLTQPKAGGGVRVGELLAEGTRLLEHAGVDTARLDAELLIAKALGLTRIELYGNRDRELSADELAAARALVDRRVRREPAAYILGEWGFRRLMLKVDRRVLVPRPETEVVVERCLELVEGLGAPAVLDVGTGSGAIALAIADEHPGARVTAVDVSEDALEVARANAAATGLAVTFERRDLRDGLEGRYDLVVSNPPYVTAGEIEGLEPEVREWEPRIATVGADHTELIAAAAAKVLVPGGWLVLEVGDGRAREVSELVGRLGYERVRASPDLTGRDRVVEAQWTGSRRR